MSKIDNAHLESKLELRRYFLRKIVERKEPVNVLDCCAGDGVIWSRLRSEFPVASYMGCDKKPKGGPAGGVRIRVDSRRVLAMSGWAHNVVDIDSYVSPWHHFAELLNTCRHSVTVFLTWSVGAMLRVCRAETEFIGLGKLCLPRGLQVFLVSHVLPHALASARRKGFVVGEVIEAFPQSNARYIGVELLFTTKDTKGTK